MGMERVLLLTK